MGARVLVIDDSPTIRKLVSAILERHDYEPFAAADGQAGLDRLRQGGVDLVLLDFVMPHMNGYQFCREMRADENLTNLPIVLMSAKAEKIRGQFVQQTGAVDAITKPFDARGLLAVVESALQKAAGGRVRQIDSIPLDEEDISLIELEDRDSGTIRAEEELSKKDLVADMAEKLAAMLGPALTEMPEQRRRDEGEVVETIRRTLGQSAVAELRALFGPSSLGSAEEGFGGSLHVIPLAEVLQVLQLQRQTGTCKITNGKVEVTISFRDGLIDLARGKGAADEFRLGRYFIEEGLIKRAELDEILKDRLPGTNKLLGEGLIHFGVISDDDLRRALIRQTSELIYEVLRWPRGHFGFSKDIEDRGDVARLGLPVASIVMEGFRRVDEWRLIEESIHFDEVLLRDQVALDALGAEKLTRQEQLMLDAIDGQRTVREVIGNVDVGSFDACKILYQFLQSRLVRRRAA
ncbi:MAG TPA: response regulator [Polyangiaceae bacterium]|nr:response regulator [Polyangiaceae bacterium]